MQPLAASVCVGLAVLLLVYFGLPQILAYRTQFRFSSISPRSARGIEWRPKSQHAAVVPTVRIERVGWGWGGRTADDVGWVVIRIEGVAVRVRRATLDAAAAAAIEKPRYPKRTGGSKVERWAVFLATRTLHLVVHHWFGLARLFSIQVTDLRVIFDDLDGMEVTIDDARAGLKVIFEGKVDRAMLDPSMLSCSPDSTPRLGHPFSPPQSPDMLCSPAVARFSDPFSPLHSLIPPRPCPDPEERFIARTRRQASVFQSAVSSSVFSIWTHAVGRGKGSVSLTASVSGLAVILPHFNPPQPASARPSIGDLNGHGLRSLCHKASAKSLKEDRRPTAFPLHSSKSVFPSTNSRYGITSGDGGLEKLLEVDGRSVAVLGMGFAPHKGLLGEGTLSASMDVGNVKTSLGALEKVQEMVQERKARERPVPDPPRRIRNRWSPRGTLRTTLRSLEFVSVSLSSFSLAHFLPAAQHSAQSSSTELSSLQDDDLFQISLSTTDIYCRLSAADSTNNERARNAFGSNSNPACRIKGVAYTAGWGSIDLQCIAPGESHVDRDQLFAIREAEFEGLTTWRPKGWTREELLFSTDPNIALIVGRGSINSVDVSGDVQLLTDLLHSWKKSRPKPPEVPPEAPSEKVRDFGLPPRVRMVLDIGHAMVVIADRVSEHKTTLSLASDGLHLGCFTSFSDVIGRRPDRSSTKEAFKKEDELRARREDAEGVDYTQPVSMLKPHVRRQYSTPCAQLRDDFSLRMSFEASLAVQPISFHLTLGERDTKTYHLASIGTAFGTYSGDVYGRHEMDMQGNESAQLEFTSTSSQVDLGIDSGIKVNMWQPAVLDALVAMGGERRLSEPRAPPARSKQVLAGLPSGVTARLSLGLISIFVGHKDPNPNCKLHLIRGLWVQTSATFEFAHYSKRSQATNCRHPLNGPTRSKLRLPEDINTQALAVYYSVSPNGGRAALVSAVLVDFFVKPIWHGQRFADAGGTSMSHAKPEMPQQRPHDDYVGWEFRRPQEHDEKWGEFANSLPPLEISGTDQAQRPMLQIKEGRFKLSLRQFDPDAHVSKRLQGKVDPVKIVSDLSHIYACLLAVLVIKKLHKAWAKPHPPNSAPAPPRHTSLEVDINLPSVVLHMAFPLMEQIVVQVSSAGVSKRWDTGIIGRAESILAYVPSPRETGSWEELARIRKLVIKTAPPDQPPEFDINADAMRVRIPHTYELSKLVLNINVSVKSLKLLLLDIFKADPTEGFQTSRIPSAEEPKKIPPLHFAFRHLVLEAQDNPIETRLNRIWRVGLVAQKARNELEDEFEKKVRIIAEAEAAMSDDDESPNRAQANGNGRFPNRLTSKHSVSLDEARYRLDWYKSQKWIARVAAAREEQKRREQEAVRPVHITTNTAKLPISIVDLAFEAPLFRSTFEGVKLSITQPGWDREEIIKYMGDCSAPFKPDVEFSLMVPLHLSWTMEHAEWRLRDYPLALIKIPRRDPIPPHHTNKPPPRPVWHVETPFIIAEELVPGRDSVVFLPCEVVPGGLGDEKSNPFTLQIAKTIMPVKTYARPEVKIMAKNTTEFTWGNSYQPAIQDLVRVIETLSHPPRDPSAKIGFWDKFRLILHWTVRMSFESTVHLHLKGSRDPYSIEGLGAGFALAWRGNTKLEIGHKNPQYELIQISSDTLMIAIPDMTALRDDSVLGVEHAHPEPDHESGDLVEETSLIERRYTKPCARFMNGTRVGFGFRFERTCRPWSCEKNCGSTDVLMHRQCRIFDFKQHQNVILRSKEAVDRESDRLGHASDSPGSGDRADGQTADSYEGFRSDYIHFSVSLVSPADEARRGGLAAEADKHNSMHLTPKAFAHFFAWWKLFDHTLSLPIRQGKLFPNTPPASKSFGRSLGTIKYRFDLAPLFVSHVYAQMRKDLWQVGMSECLGLKVRFARFRADAHQRAQEKVVRHEQLDRTTVVTHKPFYAADLLLEDIDCKGIRAHFNEDLKRNGSSSVNSTLTKASEHEPAKRVWFNHFDYVDADRKPLDRNPGLQVVDFGDCPRMFFSKRVKARPTTAQDQAASQSAGGEQLENTKFGHEPSHICYLGAAATVGDTQARLVRDRIEELEDHLRETRHVESGSEPSGYSQIQQDSIMRTLRTLRNHLMELRKEERRTMDDNTFQAADQQKDVKNMPGSQQQQDAPFENTFHIHCPRIMWTNDSRNIVFEYFFSSRDRKREEYTVSHASLRNVREGLQQRLRRRAEGRINGLNQDDLSSSDLPAPADVANQMVGMLEKRLRDPRICRHQFRLPVSHHNDHEDMRKPSMGLPDDCAVKPTNRILLLKPQVALKSNVDTDSMVVLAVEEISFKGYQIVDENATDEVAADVMSRQYVSLKGVQAFYPSTETMKRERSTDGIPKGLEFLPLEIFLDVRSEATDYDRIVLKTDAAMAMDRFNHLRVPRGLEWPEAVDEDGEPIHHLRLHQDLSTVTVPRIAVSATSQHYAALYNVVTDLLMYQDPGHRRRSQRVDEFLLQFDRRDRDPNKLLVDLFNLQREIRELEEKHRGYEQNVDRLDEQGRQNLVHIRADHLEYMDHLFTVFDAISVNFAKDDARAMLKAASRLEVRAGGIAWHMLQDTFKPLIKLDIERTLVSYLSNKDGSTDMAIAVGDLAALNSNADVLYPEVLARWNENVKVRKGEQPPPLMGRDAPFTSVYLSTMAPVGGIPIVRDVVMKLHPVRFKLEEQYGHQFVDYIFRRKRDTSEKPENGKKKEKEKDKDKKRAKSPDKRSVLMTPLNGNNPSTASLPLAPLSRTQSEVSLSSLRSGRSASAATTLDSGGSEDDKPSFPLTSNLRDAQEMRRRASSNKTFERIVFGNTAFILDFKGDGKRRKLGIPLPDVVGFQFRTPDCVYYRKLWTYEDVFEHVKRDVRAHLWAQSGDLLSQILKNTSLLRSKKGLASKQAAALHSLQLPLKSTLGGGGSNGTSSNKSKLRYHVEPPTPTDTPPILEMESPSSANSALSRIATKAHEIGEELARTLSKTTSSNGDMANTSPTTRIRTLEPPTPESLSNRQRSTLSPARSLRGHDHDDGDEDDDSDRDQSLGKVAGRKMKGFLHKLHKRRGSDGRDGPRSSSEELTSSWRRERDASPHPRMG